MENKFKNIGQAVRALRKERQLTLQQLADSIPGNFDAGNLSRFERGEQGISENKLHELCAALGVSVSDLYAMTEGKRGLTLGPFTLNLIADKRSENVNPHAGKTPLISWNTAGTLTEQANNYQVGDAEDWLPCPPNCQENSTFALRLTGDSMDDGTAQGYHDGEIIFIDRTKSAAEHNADVLVKTHNGGVTFKRLIQSDGSWYLKPLNPNWPTKIIELGSSSHIVGRVLFSCRFRA